MDYKDLKPHQKQLFDDVERLVNRHHSMKEKDLLTVLGILINKYKGRTEQRSL